MSQGESTIPIQGYALREIRIRTGLEVAQLAAEVGVTRAYIARIELGHSRRVSATVYEALLNALQIRDRRALLANLGHDVVPASKSGDADEVA